MAEGLTSDDDISNALNSLTLNKNNFIINGFSGPAVQINGRKVLGPLPEWQGPPPTNACELFIKKIPKNLPEESLLPHFQRFGQIYEFRLMMDFNECNRGYGFLKYTNEEDASRGMEIMNHFYVEPGKLLDIQRSYDKCRLFVGNLPKHLSREEIEYGFRSAFPKMERLVMHNRISDGNKNRGFVFIDFPNHQEALFVKKQTTPGRLRKWGRDLKIVWANPERFVDPDAMNTVKTLFVRNVDLSVNTKELFDILTSVVKRSDIIKIARVREFAFIDFASRSAAEKIFDTIQGIMLKGHNLEFEWALPPGENSVHTLKNYDFDAVLRLKCIANYWTTPVVIFGRIFDTEELQYAAVMIRATKKLHAFFFEIHTKNLSDIQGRICEVIVTIIEKFGNLPMYNYVIKLIGDIAHLIGIISDLSTATFVKATSIRSDMFLYWDEIRDLSLCVHQLSRLSHESIVILYNNSVQRPTGMNFIQNFAIGDRILGCIQSNYRNKPPLKYRIDNTQLIFALCSTYSYTNYIFPNISPVKYNFKDNEASNFMNSGILYSVINLLPFHFAQSKSNHNIINAIYFGYASSYQCTTNETVPYMQIKTNTSNTSSPIY